MGFYTQGKKKVQFSAFKDEKAGKLQLIQVLLPKFPLGWEKQKVDINNIVLVAKK